MNSQERLGLETVLLLYGRPSVEVNNDRLASVPPFWNVLEDQREDIEMAQRGVGRIELFGHPEYDWAGTAFLVNDTTLMTTRRTAEIFLENRRRPVAIPARHHHLDELQFRVPKPRQRRLPRPGRAERPQ